MQIYTSAKIEHLKFETWLSWWLDGLLLAAGWWLFFPDFRFQFNYLRGYENRRKVDLKLSQMSHFPN